MKKVILILTITNIISALSAIYTWYCFDSTIHHLKITGKKLPAIFEVEVSK